MDRDRDRERDRERDRDRERLDRPSRPLDRMDIAGTNGRGSVVSRPKDSYGRGMRDLYILPNEMFFSSVSSLKLYNLICTVITT